MSKTPPPPSSNLLRQELNALEDAVSADKEATAEAAARSATPRPLRHKRASTPALPRGIPKKPA